MRMSGLLRPITRLAWLRESAQRGMLHLGLSTVVMVAVGCVATDRHVRLGCDDLRAVRENRLDAATKNPQGARAEVTLIREAAELTGKINTSSNVLYACESASGPAFTSIDPFAITNHAKLVGKRVLVSGLLDIPATRELKLPVLRAVTVQEAGLIPVGFQVPTLVRNQRFEVRPLAVRDVVADYDAVMSSRQRLSNVFGPGGNGWPRADMTLEQNLKDLAWHEDEWNRRTSFAYAVFTADGSEEIGCIYFFPSGKRDFDARAIVWVRASRANMDDEILLFTQNWLHTAWPFRKVGFPGRGIPWPEWEALP